MDSFIRFWRVESALAVCYILAWRRGDRATIQYCLKHRVLVNTFWFTLVLSPMLWVIVTRFIQYGWR